MKAASAAFASRLTQSHTPVIQAQVLRNGQPIGDPLTGTAILGGQVTLDAAASIRGRADLTIIDAGDGTLVPTGPTSLLAHYGNELQISRGILHEDGTTETVPLIVARIDSAPVSETGQGVVIQVTGQDRAAIVADATFEDPYEIASGTNVATAILTTVTAGYPSVIASFPTITATTPTVVAEEGDDRWEFCTRLAKAAGMRLFFDGAGALRLEHEVTAGVPVLSFDEGGTLYEAAASSTGREGVYNRVIASGENTGLAAPVRGVATDTNPDSPSYYDGVFGRKPRRYSSPLLLTDAQCRDAAATILARSTSSVQTVDFRAAVDPRAEPGDLVHIKRRRVGVDGVYVLDALTIPLDTREPAMSGRARRTPTSTFTRDGPPMVDTTS